jgi:hypothetical protein
MQPVAKVKSRLNIRLPENDVPDLCQSDLISPIGRMNLSPAPVVKVFIDSNIVVPLLFLSFVALVFNQSFQLFSPFLFSLRKL